MWIWRWICWHMWIWHVSSEYFLGHVQLTPIFPVCQSGAHSRVWRSSSTKGADRMRSG
jgi:hypothetical protein